MNPVCFFVPTAITFPKKKMDSVLFRYVPESMVPMISSGGFINMGIFSVDKKNQLDITFVLFISLLIVAQHVSGNHVPIIRS